MKCRQSLIKSLVSRCRLSQSLVILSLLFVTLGFFQVGCNKKSSSSQSNSGGGVQPPPQQQPPQQTNTSLNVVKAGQGNGTVSSTPNGINCGSDCSETYSNGAQVTLVAVPNGSSVFSGWSGGCSNTGNCVVTLSTNTTVTAIFDTMTPTVNVNKTGAGNGVITSNPSGIDCGTDCSESYPLNSVVSLSASPTDGVSQFTGWSGACSGVGPCLLTVSSGKTVTANFDQIKNALTVTKIGLGVGSVVSSPSGIQCGTDCSEDYLMNTLVTLAATPNDPATTFSGWSGACSGITSCVVTMNSVKNVTAMFDQVKPTVSVTKMGTGFGTVTSAPQGISCGTDCTEDYLFGTSVSLTATPTDATSVFQGWGGACSGLGACVQNVDSGKSVTATFVRVLKTLNVSMTGAGDGRVVSNPIGIDCANGVGVCTQDYVVDSLVSLTPTPKDIFSEFLGWGGACSGVGPCAVQMSNIQNVSAMFGKVTKKMLVTKSGLGSGKVVSAPVGIDCGDGGSDCNEDYFLNTSVNLTPLPTDIFSEFTGWGGACSGMGACTVIMDNIKNVTVNFGKVTKILTVSTSGSGSGKVVSSPVGIDCGTDCSEPYFLNTDVSLSPIPSSPFMQFSGWAGDCNGTGPCNLFMSQPKNVTATFDLVHFNGVWSGTTNQGLPITFYVVNDAVVGSTITMRLVTPGFRCAPVMTVTQQITFGNPLPITSPSFSFSRPGLISGTFSSGVDSSGSYQFSDSFCQASVSPTWTASYTGASSFSIGSLFSVSSLIDVDPKNHKVISEIR